MSIDQDIKQFCDYFEQQAQEINAIQPAEKTDYGISQIKLYKKTLYVTAIDTLAGFRFSKNEYKDDFENLKKKMELYLSQNKHPYKYPKDHLHLCLP